MKRKYIFLFISVTVILTAIALYYSVSMRKRIEISETQLLMGTFCDIKVVGYNKEKLEHSLEKAFSKLREIEEYMSIYNPSSAVSLINQRAYLEPVYVDNDLFELLRISKRYSQVFSGVFDITVYPLVELWGFHKKGGEFLSFIPSENDIINTDVLRLGEN